MTRKKGLHERISRQLKRAENVIEGLPQWMKNLEARRQAEYKLEQQTKEKEE